MNISQDWWRSAAVAEREALARQLAARLPSGFSLDKVSGQNAFFLFESARFVLIPGGVFTVGFDGRSWLPTPEESESWAMTSQQYGVSESIQERVYAVTLRPREVKISPMLVETEARELGWENVAPDTPEIASLLKKHPDGVQICGGGKDIRVSREADGSITAEQSVKQTHADLLESFRASGFRFPSSDEWEYLCGGGASTLFRWGDHSPMDRYPLESARRRKQREADAAQLKTPTAFSSDWDLHRRPNALGISIAANPYHCELTSDVGITRGGDGGCTLCGGYGYFVGWLTLATSYFEPHYCEHDPAEPISVGYTFGRRVLELR